MDDKCIFFEHCGNNANFEVETTTGQKKSICQYCDIARLKAKCHHFDECGNEAVYALSLVDDTTIHVCESCDEMYSACEYCGKQGIYEEMSLFDRRDDWRSCPLCHEKQEAKVRAELKDDIAKFLSKNFPDKHQKLPRWAALEIYENAMAILESKECRYYNENDIQEAFSNWEAILKESKETYDNFFAGRS